MWGTFKHAYILRGRPRFIPTHVGYMIAELESGTYGPVHPHACGVHSYFCHLLAVWCRFIPTHVGYIKSNKQKRILIYGSSPRMWGTLKDCIVGLMTVMVHPHACGVHVTGKTQALMPLGSSPRMWGTYHLS